MDESGHLSSQWNKLKFCWFSHFNLALFVGKTRILFVSAQTDFPLSSSSITKIESRSLGFAKLTKLEFPFTFRITWEWAVLVFSSLALVNLGKHFLSKHRIFSFLLSAQAHLKLSSNMHLSKSRLEFLFCSLSLHFNTLLLGKRGF